MFLRTIKLAILIFFVITLSKMVAINCFATDGSKVYELEKKREELLKRNLDLGNRLAKVASIQYIERRAKDLGMSKAKDVDFVTPSVVASR